MREHTRAPFTGTDLRHRLAVAAISTSLIVLGLALSGLGASAQQAAPTTEQTIVGSWQLTITDTTDPADPQARPALATFFADGTLMTSDAPVTILQTGDASVPISVSAGHGAWELLGPPRVALTFVQLASDQAGQFVGTVTVSSAVVLDASDTVSGTFFATVLGADGLDLGSRSGTLEGTRIHVALTAGFTFDQVPGTFDIAFTDTSSGSPTGWNWDFGDGSTGSKQNPVHSYAQAGDYEVTVTVTDTNSSGTRTKTVTVAPVAAPVAGFTSKQTVGTLEVAFSDTSTGDPTTWSWDFGDSKTSKDQNPTHAFAKSGEHIVKLTVTNAGGSDSRTRTVTVAAIPLAAGFTSKQKAGTLEVAFTDASVGDPTSWSWDFGDSGSSTKPNPSHTYGGAGDYTVVLTVMNNKGDTVSKTKSVRVSAP